MKPQFLLKVFTLLILLQGCKSKEESPGRIPDLKFTIPQPDQSPPDLVVYTGAISIYGEWFNINPDIFIKLIINKDGTFQYINKSGLKDSVKGKWTVKGTEYILHNGNNNMSIHSSEKQIFFKKRFSFKNGFLYELTKQASLSNDYFVQSKNYR